MNPSKKKPSRQHATVLLQLVELIPAYLVSKLARVHGVDRKIRTFNPWNRVAAFPLPPTAHALSFNDVCDALRLWRTPLPGATPSSHTNLSNANRTRDAGMAERLFWQVLEHLQHSFPAFGRGPTQRCPVRRPATGPMPPRPTNR